MSLLKSSLLASTCSAAGVFPAVSSPAFSLSTTSYRCMNSPTSSPLTTPQHRKRRRRTNVHLACHSYATIASNEHISSHGSRPEPSASSHDHHHPDSTTPPPWPSAPSGHAHPTPYQILSTSPSVRYSKVRFYTLVKYYHPDLCAQTTGTTSEQRLERYRLLVMAHAILSDPSKRRAYDAWGAGWPSSSSSSSFDPSSMSHSDSGRDDNDTGPFTSRAARHQAYRDGVHSNATWEDWEAWRKRRAAAWDHVSPAEPISPVYVANSTFVGLILVVVAVVGSWNFNRAEQEGERFLAARDAVHDAASKELRRVRSSVGLRPKEERIDWFVRNRQACMKYGMDLEDLRDERARSLVGPDERCGEGELNDTDAEDGHHQQERDPDTTL